MLYVLLTDSSKTSPLYNPHFPPPTPGPVSTIPLVFDIDLKPRGTSRCQGFEVHPTHYPGIASLVASRKKELGKQKNHNQLVSWRLFCGVELLGPPGWELGEISISVLICLKKGAMYSIYSKKKSSKHLSIQSPSPHFGLYISIVSLHPWCQQKQELRLWLKWLKATIVKNNWAEPPYECWLYRIGVDMSMCFDGLGLFWTVWRRANGMTGASGVMLVSRKTWLRRCWGPVVLHFMRLNFKTA